MGKGETTGIKTPKKKTAPEKAGVKGPMMEGFGGSKKEAKNLTERRNQWYSTYEEKNHP